MQIETLWTTPGTWLALDDGEGVSITANYGYFLQLVVSISHPGLS